MNLLKHCFFINLDERPDRLEHVTNELLKIGCVNPERFPAVKTEFGAIGCSISHIKCLELAKERNYPYVFICEDDIVFLKPDVLVENITKFSKSFLINCFKVLLIGGNNCPPYYNVTKFCIKVLNCQTALGYIVKQSYYDTLIANMKEGLHFLLKDPQNKPMFAVDMYWKKLQQQHDWYMIIPATVTQLVGYSNIEKQNVNYNHLMLDIDKKNLLMQRGLTFTPTQANFDLLKQNYELPLQATTNGSSSTICNEEESIKNLKKNNEKLMNSTEQSVEEDQLAVAREDELFFQEHKQKFSMIFNTIHIIPLFYNTKTFFDFILTESELDIENLIKICKKEWKNSCYDFSNYSFSDYLDKNDV